MEHIVDILVSTCPDNPSAWLLVGHTSFETALKIYDQFQEPGDIGDLRDISVLDRKWWRNYTR